MINKYNKSIDSIKSQELAITKVKNKLDELISGDKTPPSIKSMESELKRIDKEIDGLNKRKIELDAEIKFNQQEFNNAKKNNDSLKMNISTRNINQADSEILNLESRMTELALKSDNLSQKINDIKINPLNSLEAKELQSKLEVLNSKLLEMQNQANQTKDEISEVFDQKNKLFNFSNGVNEISTKIDSFKTKMSRLIGTAMIFSLLRSGLTSFRNDLIGLLKTNDVFKSSLNQIKANLMTAFAPIYNACLPAINALMNALSKITGTIAKFVASLFGLSLKDANKQAKKLSGSLKKVAKNGDDATGSLASFDKLEVLDNGSEKNGADSDGGGMSNVDYSGEIQYSQKLLDFLNNIKDFISDNKEDVIGFLLGIAGGILAIKLGVEGFQALGIGIAIYGIIGLIGAVLDFIKEPTWDNFGKILQYLAIALTGVAIALLAVNAANPVAWIMLAIAAFAGIIAIIIKYRDQILAFIQGIWSFVAGIFSGVGTFFKNAFVSAYNAITGVFSSIPSFFSNLWSKIKNVFSNIGTKVGNVVSNAFITVVNAVLSTIEKVLNTPINAINKMIGVINKLPGVDIDKMATFKLPRLAEGTVIPPRHEFAAILGDQKHGTNIEAPLETIKQANREVLVEFFNKFKDLTNDIKEIVFKNFTIVAQFGNRDFQKLVIEAVRLTEKEIGRPLFVN